MFFAYTNERRCSPFTTRNLFPFLFFPSPPPRSFPRRVISRRSVLTRNLFFFFLPPPPPSLPFLLLFFFLFFFFLYPRTIEKPTTDAHCEHRPPFGFSPPPPLPPPSPPPFPSSLFLSRGLFGGRERTTGWPRREQEGKGEKKKRNPTSWPKLFSEIRRFFRASSEMIFARINPYGRHGNRSASALSTPDVQSLETRPPESSNGRGGGRGRREEGGARDSNSRFREHAAGHAAALLLSIPRFLESLYTIILRICNNLPLVSSRPPASIDGEVRTYSRIVVYETRPRSVPFFFFAPPPSPLSFLRIGVFSAYVNDNFLPTLVSPLLLSPFPFSSVIYIYIYVKFEIFKFD